MRPTLSSTTLMLKTCKDDYNIMKCYWKWLRLYETVQAQPNKKQYDVWFKNHYTFGKADPPSAIYHCNFEDTCCILYQIFGHSN